MISGVECDLVKMLRPHVSPKNVAAMTAVTTYLGSPATLGRILSSREFETDLDTMASALRSVYGLDDGGGWASDSDSSAVAALAARRTSTDGMLQPCTMRAGPPKTFRIAVAGLPEGTRVCACLPCCGTLVKFTVSTINGSVPRYVCCAPTASCIAKCGPAGRTYYE